jgi:hypothetical protein
MSDLLARFADLRRDNPPRPMIHLPYLGALTADDVWDAHLRYADCMRGRARRRPARAGRRQRIGGHRLSARLPRADVAMMPVDAGRHRLRSARLWTDRRAAC